MIPTGPPWYGTFEDALMSLVELPLRVSIKLFRSARGQDQEDFVKLLGRTLEDWRMWKWKRLNALHSRVLGMEVIAVLDIR